MNNYVFKFNKGETFRRVLTWKDAAGTNLFTMATSVVMEIKAPSKGTETVNLTVVGDSVTITRPYADLERVNKEAFSIFANMNNGDRVLILKGEFQAYA